MLLFLSQTKTFKWVSDLSGLSLFLNTSRLPVFQEIRNAASGTHLAPRDLSARLGGLHCGTLGKIAAAWGHPDTPREQQEGDVGVQSQIGSALRASSCRLWSAVAYKGVVSYFY